MTGKFVVCEVGSSTLRHLRADNGQRHFITSRSIPKLVLCGVRALSGWDLKLDASSLLRLQQPSSSFWCSECVARALASERESKNEPGEDDDHERELERPSRSPQTVN